jgi:transcriptional regulator PpsR
LEVEGKIMDADVATPSSTTGLFSRGLLGDLDSSVARKVVAAGGDVALVIDREGVICDLAVSNEAIARDGANTWLDRRWSDTVTIDSKKKVDELLRDAAREGPTRWREVNQVTPSQKSLMIRYMAVEAGREGQVIAIGRDDRATAAVQQRLVEAQQALERDYSRIRDAEFRYRLLFQMSGEAVLVIDAATRKIIEANPAAETFVGSGAPLVGEPFVKIFALGSQDDAASLLTVAQSTSRKNAAQVRLSGAHRDFLVSASLFRQDRASQYLVRLSPADHQPIAADAGPDLKAVIERIPDAFLITDDALKILVANEAFLDLVRIGTQEQAIGQSLANFLGRAGLERNILIDNLRAHGSVRNFSTLLRNQFDEQEDVEVSAVAVPGPEVHFGFTIRTVSRYLNDRAKASPELRRSVEQLTELVGRVTLKELVRETTDLVERLCIEAALELTKDNRASAAEILGLSRQSLYSKLHRFKLGNLTEGKDAKDLQI